MSNSKSEQKNKVTFEEDGVKVCVKRPSNRQLKDAQVEGARAFSEAIRNKFIVRKKLMNYMREQDMWSDEEDERLKEINERLEENELKLSKGGIKKSEAKKIALQMVKDRNERTQMLSEYTLLDANTAEGYSENTRFNYLVSVCTLDAESGARKFQSLDDYNDNSSEPWAIKAAETLADMLYGLDNDIESKLPENKFLKDYGFVDDQLRLIDEDGNYVNELGQRVNERGQLVDDDGDVIDVHGNKINPETGDFVVEFKPFLDDEENEEKEKMKKAKKIISK